MLRPVIATGASVLLGLAALQEAVAQQRSNTQQRTTALQSASPISTFGSAGAAVSGGQSGTGQQFQSSFQTFVSRIQQAGSTVGAAAPTASVFANPLASSTTGTATQGYGGLGMLGGLGMMGRGGMLGGLSSFGFGGFGRGGMYGRNQFGGMQNNAAQTQRQVRTRLNVDFPTRAPSGTLAGQRLQNRLTTTPHITVVAPVTVTMDGSTAVLRGTVESDHQRDLAGRLAMLEPAVADVRNELKVATAASAAAGSSMPAADAATRP